MRIRELTYGDNETVLALLSELTGGRETNFNIEDLIADLNCICLVLEEENEIVGFGSAIIYHTPAEGLISRMEDLVVSEQAKGKGYGRALAEELIRRAKQAGARKMDLTSNLGREAARGLYKSLGFEECETAVFTLKF